jgi:hypothetical protein
MSARQRLFLILVGVISALVAPQITAKADGAPLRAGVAEAQSAAEHLALNPGRSGRAIR